jgi:hypothetical protein
MEKKTCLGCFENRCFQNSPDSFIRYHLEQEVREEIPGTIGQDCAVGILFFGICQICEQEGIQCKKDGENRIMSVNRSRKIHDWTTAGIDKCPIFKNAKGIIHTTPRPLRQNQVLSLAK